MAEPAAIGVVWVDTEASALCCNAHVTLGTTLGIPASSKAQAIVAPNLAPLDAAILKYYQDFEKIAKPQLRPWARGRVTPSTPMS